MDWKIHRAILIAAIWIAEVLSAGICGFIAALALKLLPEYLRAFAEYRMLVFGAVMVLMMIFRPQGLINNMRRKYEYDTAEKEGDHDSK